MVLHLVDDLLDVEVVSNVRNRNRVALTKLLQLLHEASCVVPLTVLLSIERPLVMG